VTSLSRVMCQQQRSQNHPTQVGVATKTRRRGYFHKGIDGGQSSRAAHDPFKFAHPSIERAVGRLRNDSCPDSVNILEGNRTRDTRARGRTSSSHKNPRLLSLIVCPKTYELFRCETTVLHRCNPDRSEAADSRIGAVAVWVV